jgi:hypothetical protein
VQTFLPYADFAATAAVLDDRRLGKQRVEALQIVRALTWPTYGWKHHPAVRMWEGRVEALGRYGLVVCAEWVRRGRADTCAATIRRDLDSAGVAVIRGQETLRRAGLLPGWLGDARLHDSHRAALVRKDPEHYSPLFPDVDPQLPYFWPDPEQQAQ